MGAAINRYAAISGQFYGNRLLFGDPADARSVAIEVASRNEIEVFKRVAADQLVRERRPLRLFALAAGRDLFEGFRVPHDLIDLAGGFRFRYLAEFRSVEALEAARRHLRKVTGKAPGASDAPYLVLADPIEQYLMLTGTTLFMGMQFGDLHRMQLDIETYVSAGFEFPSAARPGDRVIAIALTDSRGFERVLSAREMDERTMLLELVRIVRERDPDVIEGHNLFRFDLEYLETRARRHHLTLALGRDGSGLRARASRMQDL